MTTRSVEAQLVNLPIEQLQASSTNPRQHVDRASLDELKASITVSGIQTPLLVRPRVPDSGAEGVFAPGEAEYEVVAGGRRFRAAQELELEDVPCIVREMSDEEAREAQIIENLQRAGVDPLEEAEAFRELQNRLGSVAAVAAKLGKEQSYVAKCLRLLALTLPSSDALRGRLITIEHALLLARLAETEQNEALKWCLDHTAGSKKPVAKVIEEGLEWIKKIADDPSRFGHHYVWEPQSAAKLKAHIESEGGIKLSRAPWDMEADALLPDVPACARCEKNTKANAPLFGDLDMGDPTCTDGACFQAKTDAFVQIALRWAGHDEGAKPKKLVPRLSWKSSSVKPSIVPKESSMLGSGSETANPAKLLKYGQWIDAKAGSCPNVRPGVTADWSDSGQRGYMGSAKKLRVPGEALLVCIAVGCKVHRKGYEPAESSKQVERRDPAAEKRKQEEQEHVEKVEEEIRTKVFIAIVRKLAEDPAKALRLVADEDREAPAIRKNLLQEFPKLSGDQLEMLTIFVGLFRLAAVDVNAWYLINKTSGVADDRKQTWKLAKSAGVDADAIAARHFHDAGSIAPWSERLYPKGVKWPKESAPEKAAKAVKQIPSGNDNKKTAAKAPAKKVAKKTAKKAVKKAAKKGAKA